MAVFRKGFHFLKIFLPTVSEMYNFWRILWFFLFDIFEKCNTEAVRVDSHFPWFFWIFLNFLLLSLIVDFRDFFFDFLLIFIHFSLFFWFNWFLVLPEENYINFWRILWFFPFDIFKKCNTEAVRVYFIFLDFFWIFLLFLLHFYSFFCMYFACTVMSIVFMYIPL